MATVLSNNVLVNGLRTEFADTYSAIRNRQADSRLGQVMDLSVSATNRNHDFAYFEAAPHMTYWQRGDTVPTDVMGSVQFNVPIYEWARRVPWSKWDRKDDQTQSLMDVARMAGQSAALLPERFFFDLLTGSTNTLPAVPNAPDGVAFFSATDGSGGNRFGISGGNTISTDGVAATHQIRTNYYECLQRWKRMQDGKGQPLLSDETIDGGTFIIHSAEDNEIFEQTFLTTLGPAGITGTGAIGTPSGGAATAISNLVKESGRTVDLWSTSRLSTGSWYIFLKNAPKKPTFLLTREGVQEFSSLEGDNNGDHTRDTAEEYVQWEERSGAGVALPFGAIKVS